MKFNANLHVACGALVVVVLWQYLGECFFIENTMSEWLVTRKSKSIDLILISYAGKNFIYVF